MAHVFRTTSTAPIHQHFDDDSESDAIPPAPDLNARILASRNQPEFAALRSARVKAAMQPVAPPTRSPQLRTASVDDDIPPPPDLNARIRTAAAAARGDLATLNFAHPSDCSGCPACNAEFAKSLLPRKPRAASDALYTSGEAAPPPISNDAFNARIRARRGDR